MKCLHATPAETGCARVRGGARDPSLVRDLSTHAPTEGPRATPRPPHRRRTDWLSPAPLLAALMTLTGCATGVPESIRDPNVSPVDVAQVQGQPQRYLGQRVRWGGSIIGITNGKRLTEIEILARPLDASGAPNRDAPGRGRFIAEVTSFLDPAEYPKDRELTLVGILIGVVTRPVGEFPYDYPVVRTEARHLWPVPASVLYGPPYPGFGPWYDPWFGPWYDPWYRPFYRPYVRRPRRHRH